MQVLVTGADGFMGRNLICRLKEIDGIETSKFTRENNLEQLKEIAPKADWVVHLAGINRPENDVEFVHGNVNLTETLCDALTTSPKKIPIVYSSSIQAENDSPYGKSKRAAEKVIETYGAKTGSDVYLYRFTNVFGKWGRPEYNSVVATFCHNIANGLPITINDPKTKLSLVYIDDVVNDIITVLRGKKTPGFCEISPVYQTSLGQLADQVRRFADSRKNLTTQAVGKGFVRALYATYLSYLKPDTFRYPLEKHGDDRGDFVEVLKTQDSGQFSYFTAHPGVTRGGHYHHTKNEKFLVVKGQAMFRFENIETGEKKTVNVTQQHPEVIETIPGWAHDITNTGDTLMVVLLWANEIFDQGNPDTYSFRMGE